jgi:UDP:flavonoid glycosyltransferase YjiC (YdhE family)
VAETSGVRWVSSALQPLVFFSAYDPPVMPTLPLGERLPALGPAVNRAITGLGKRVTWPWTAPLRALRLELGLAENGHPLYEGQHSPILALGLFSKHFGPPQRDWPRQVRVTGFLFYDEHERLPSDLERFLAAGEPPIVFTLGSAAVYSAGDFYAESLKAVTAIGRRALLLTGHALRQQLPAALPGGVMTADYAPYAAIFPRGAALVHQGGIGTTAQALRAGRPMLVVPFSHDQPDNALRVERLGAGLYLPRGQYRAERARAALERLLSDRRFETNATRLGEAVRAEDGLTQACDALEAALAEQ